jgi:hypothetical protein
MGVLDAAGESFGGGVATYWAIAGIDAISRLRTHTALNVLVSMLPLLYVYEWLATARM